MPTIAPHYLLICKPPLSHQAVNNRQFPFWDKDVITCRTYNGSLRFSITIVRGDEKQRCVCVCFPRLFFSFSLRPFRAFVYPLHTMSKSLFRPHTLSSSAHALPTGTYHRLERTDPRIIACFNLKGLPSLPEEDESCERRSRVFHSDPSFDPFLFSSPPRPAPQPPQHSMKGDIELCLAGKSFNFPHPPLAKDSTVSLTRSPATRAVSRKRMHSPASSISSAASSSSDDTIGQTPLTPSSSDDEHIPTSLSVTAPNSKRLSVLFTKSMPDLRPPSPQITTVEEIPEEDGEEAEWLTQEMQDFVTLSSSPVSDENLSSRPESFLPSLRLSNALLEGLSPVAGPSAQLDPTFHSCQKKTRSFVIPSRPPPPPPIQICPASPLNDVFGVSSPSFFTPATPPTLNSSRPPPRSSIPSDVDELMQMDLEEFEDFLDLKEVTDSHLESPFNSIFHPYQHSPAAPFGFSIDDLPTTPSSFAFSDDSHLYDFPRSPLRRSSSSISTASSATRRLRSKWSSSTLGSVYNNQPQPSSWMSKFSFKKGSNKEKAVPSTHILPSPSKSAKKEKRRKFAGSDIVVRHSYESDVTQIGRRDSGGSRNSSESAESSPSPGLRRKPIPVEIFMKQ